MIARKRPRLYVDPRPTTMKGKVRAALMALLAQHKVDDALPTSARFLFYELVASGVIRKNEAARVSQCLTDLRKWERVPWDWIVDETRTVHDFTGSESVTTDWLRYLDGACIDPWEGEPPLILCESRSLAGVLRGLAHEYRVRIAATNGQVGGFLRTDVAPLLSAGSTVVYLGDLDLAGGQIEANTRRVLEDIIGELDWLRLALTQEQADEYDLPSITKYDNRYSPPRAHEAIETEALSQTIIVNIVRDWLTAALPEPLELVLEREHREREQLRSSFEAGGGG